ncbi:MAG: YkgJ family cysteine cluster protein [Candidatus Thorarchaeota archaeon]
MERVDTNKICRECGGYCCSFGGTIATRLELDEILEKGHANHFVGISKDCHITLWGDDGICPYLKDSICTIYDVRPTVCKKFPILSVNNSEHFLVHCPLTSHLSEEELADCKKLASWCSDEMFAGANVYLEPYSRILEERMSKFRMDPIDLE